MNECYGQKFILNSNLLTSDMFDNSLVYEGESIYEVIRMVKGNPVFFHDHIARLQKSLALQQKKNLADPSQLRRDIINLTKTHKKKEANLKIVFNYKKDTGNYLVYFIDSVYPTFDQYRKGVPGTLFTAERRDPESKLIDNKLRSSIYHKLMHAGAYEALLINSQNEITEGSRSNIFFLKENILFTAPDDMVLKGITRKYILLICGENKIPVNMKPVKFDEISDFEAVFMTGTSPMVLPFCCIDKVKFNVSHPVIATLRDLYLKKVEESIVHFRAE